MFNLKQMNATKFSNNKNTLILPNKLINNLDFEDFLLIEVG